MSLQTVHMWRFDVDPLLKASRTQYYVPTYHTKGRGRSMGLSEPEEEVIGYNEMYLIITRGEGAIV